MSSGKVGLLEAYRVNSSGFLVHGSRFKVNPHQRLISSAIGWCCQVHWHRVSLILPSGYSQMS